MAGGDPVKLTEVVTDNPGGAWGSDGFLYFTPSWNSGLWRISEKGGTPERLTEPDASMPGAFHGWPSPLPDGRGVVFTANGPSGLLDARIEYLDLATRQVTVLGAGAAAQYVAGGEVVFFRHGSWFAAPFDVERRKLGGPERRVLADAQPLYPAGGKERVVSFSDTGRLVYIASPTLAAAPVSQLAWIDRAGGIERLPFEGSHLHLALSADDRKAAVSLSETGELQVWIYDLDRGTRDRLTRDGVNDRPAFSPDGSRLVVTNLTRGNYDLHLVDANGQNPPVELAVTAQDEDEATWTPDGKAILFARTSSKTGVDVWVQRLDDPSSARALITTPDDDHAPRVSPDGHWLVYRSQSAFYVTPFPNGGERTKIDADGGTAAWSPSTPELFVTDGGRLVSYRYAATGGRFRVLDSKALFEVPDLPSGTDFAVSRDARRFLFFVPVPGKTLEPEVRVVSDGVAELRAPEAGNL